MNRDKSTEATAADNAEFTKGPRNMVPNQADVVMGKKTQITKAARRFERYGQVKDGQDLVRLVADIAGAVDGKPAEVVVDRHRNKATEE